MLVVARTQIGLSHTSWIANSESVNVGIGQRPTEFEHQRVPMRTHDSLPAIAHQPKSSVPVIGNAAGPKMAIPLARSAHDEPLESFPFRIAERRKR